MAPKTITFKEKTYTLDERGFLNPSDQWDENFAEGIGEMLGICGGLNEEHWRFITYLRKKFIQEETVPVIILACADNNLKLNDFRFLFPAGYHRGACKMAGINYDFMYKTNYWLTYETSTLLRSDYKITAMGFLEEYAQWDERFVQIVVREWKLSQGLTEGHRSIISYLRDYYEKRGNIPTISETCRENGLSTEKFRELFTEGYRRGACRIAGLPFFA